MLYLLPVIAMHAAAFVRVRVLRFRRMNRWAYAGLALAMLWAIILLNGRANAFIYFQF